MPIQPSKQKLGMSGEQAACDFLLSKGYRILETNYRTKIGEIDIVAQDRDTLCFVEVKLRSSRDYALPFDAVDYKKQYKLTKCALWYLNDKALYDQKARFDVVSVIDLKGQKHIDLIQNAFERRGDNF